MPIKNISDIRRLPRLGKIRLGEKVRNSEGKEYPKALDHFGCPEEVAAVFGAAPTALEVIFPVQDSTIEGTLERIFPQYLKRYGSSKGLICKGNGETAHCVDEAGEMSEVECDPEECSYYQSKQCRRVASLQFMLPQVPGFGVWQIDTTSINSIININSALDMIWRLCNKKIAGIPLTLGIEPKETHREGKKHIVHVLTLKPPFSLVELQRLSAQAGPLQIVAPLASEAQPTDLYPGAAPVKEKVAVEPEAKTGDPWEEPKAEKPEGPPNEQVSNGGQVKEKPAKPQTFPGSLDFLSEMEIAQLKRKAKKSGTDLGSWLSSTGLAESPMEIPREKAAEVHRRVDALAEA